MAHIDLLEARRLCAAGLDPSFFRAGSLALPEDYSLDGVLATHGSVYVDTYHIKRGRRQIFKYNDAGQLDTSWGTNGYIVPAISTSSGYYHPPTLVRDPRTGDLLLGGSLNGTVNIQRYTAAGKPDPAWSSNSFRVYSEAKTELKLLSLTPLPHNRVLMAFKREQQRGTFNGYDVTSLKGGADDVALLMLDRHGRYDRTFNGGHAVRVAAGSYAQTRTNAPNADKTVYTYTHTEDFTEPTFGDVQFRSDGSMRVLVTRLEAHATYESVTDYTEDEPSGGSSTTSRFVASAESIVVSATGRVLPRKSQSYLLKSGRRSTDGSTFNRYTAYLPILAVADDHDSGIAVLGNSDRGASVIRLSPGQRSRVQTFKLPDYEPYISATTHSPSGNYVFRTGGAELNTKLFVVDAHLVPIVNGTLFGEYNADYLNFTSDDANRVLALQGPDPTLVRFA